MSVLGLQLINGQFGGRLIVILHLTLFSCVSHMCVCGILTRPTSAHVLVLALTESIRSRGSPNADWRKKPKLWFLSNCRFFVVRLLFLTVRSFQGKLLRRCDLPATQHQQSWTPMLRRLQTGHWASRSTPTLSKYLRGNTFVAQSTVWTLRCWASATVPICSAPTGAC